MIYLKKFGILGLVLGEGVRQEGLIFLSSCIAARGNLLGARRRASRSGSRGGGSKEWRHIAVIML